MLESLSTEKNSLVYQLERLEQQLKAIQGSSTNGPSINMTGIDSTEGKYGNKILKILSFLRFRPPYFLMSFPKSQTL